MIYVIVVLWSRHAPRLQTEFQLNKYRIFDGGKRKKRFEFYKCFVYNPLGYLIKINKKNQKQ